MREYPTVSPGGQDGGPGHVYTPLDLAQQRGLKHQRSGGKSEWHGPNPSGFGAQHDGFILKEDGTSFERSGQHYSSIETAELFGIDPEQYAPVAEWRAQNPGHSAPRRRPSSSGQRKPRKAQAAAQERPRAAFTWETATLYPYRDAEGALLFEVGRCDAPGCEKSIRQRRPVGDDWAYDVPATIERPLWRVRDVLEAETVYVCEGEKAADALNSSLLEARLYGSQVATTAPGGAGKWKPEHSQVLAGKAVAVLPDNDAPGAAHAAQVCAGVLGLAASCKIVELPELGERGDVADFLKDGGTLAQVLAAVERAPEWKPEPQAETPETTPPAFEWATDCDLGACLQDISWLWPGYIPNGFVTALVATQDAGKSTVAQALCDVLLRGAAWPDGTPHAPEPSTHLLWIDTEGSLAIFNQRAKAWGMPRGRFVFPRDPLQELAVDDPQDWAWIEAAIERFRPPLVVIDALSGAHKSKENGNDEMKVLMKRLAGLASRFDIAVLVVHHLSKPAPGVPDFPVTVHRLRGASAISQYCRSILALGAPDPERPEARRLDVIKLNLAKKPAPVGYHLTDQGPAWGAAPAPPKPRRVVDDAVAFLDSALTNGPRPSEEVEREAQAQGIGKSALRDAKNALKVKAQREGGKEGRWLWFPHGERAAQSGQEE